MVQNILLQITISKKNQSHTFDPQDDLEGLMERIVFELYSFGLMENFFFEVQGSRAIIKPKINAKVTCNTHTLGLFKRTLHSLSSELINNNASYTYSCAAILVQEDFITPFKLERDYELLSNNAEEYFSPNRIELTEQALRH
jgi:hypothetical protein